MWSERNMRTPASRGRWRLSLIRSALCPSTTTAATPPIHALDIPDPNSRHHTLPPAERGAALGSNPWPADRTGNSPLGTEVQGLQRLGSHPPPFDPTTQEEDAFAFYQQHGYVVVSVLSPQELRDLNAVADGWRKRGEEGEDLGPVDHFFPLLRCPEFDFTFWHPKTLPLVTRILGGEEAVRLIGARPFLLAPNHPL